MCGGVFLARCSGDYLFDGKKMETKKDIDVTVDRDSNNAIPAKMLETGYSIGYVQ